LAGCGRFNRVEYDRVYVGLPAREVRWRLGRPDEVRGEWWIYTRQCPFNQARIRIEDDKVAEKRWFYERPADEADPAGP
jgi:hypothetical protein